MSLIFVGMSDLLVAVLLTRANETKHSSYVISKDSAYQINFPSGT